MKRGNSMKRWKTLTGDMKSAHGECSWIKGEWKTHTSPLEMCKSGFHCSQVVAQAMHYVQPGIVAQVEVRGEHLAEDNKEVWEEMRILHAWKWEKEDSVAMAAEAAELVLPLWEERYPADLRPRKAIESARRWLENPTKENMQAAEDAARAAEDAARAAEDEDEEARGVEDAARAAKDAAAASAAARAAEDAAWAAARAAEEAAAATGNFPWAAKVPAWAAQRAVWAVGWAAARAVASAARAAEDAAEAAEGISEKIQSWIEQRLAQKEEEK